MYETSEEVATLLRQMAEALEENSPVLITLADQGIIVPADANFRVEYEEVADAGHVVIKVTWGIPVLVRTHSEKVQDVHGNLYGVLVYGKRRADGTWEGWLEFVPANASLSTRRTSRETTQPDRSALEYWATGLEPLYLSGAFERAA
jgi:hypothetical protein